MPRGLLSQVRAISRAAVSDKGLPEMGFTLGGVDEALDPDTVVGLAVDADVTVHGVTSWLPVYSAGGTVTGWTLDVMRRLPDGFGPVTEFLIASACLSFREQGAAFVSLSGAPLAHSGGGTAERAALERLLDQLGEAMEPLYGFRSLDSFKRKFRPRHEPVHLVFSDEAALAPCRPGPDVRLPARRVPAGPGPRRAPVPQGRGSRVLVGPFLEHGREGGRLLGRPVGRVRHPDQGLEVGRGRSRGGRSPHGMLRRPAGRSRTCHIVTSGNHPIRADTSGPRSRP